MRHRTVHSWEELSTLLYQNDWKPDLGRHRSPYVFRGLEQANYPLTTSLSRHGKTMLERHLLRNFKKYAQVDSPLSSDWLWVALAQHHGLPTRLLDWTYSPFVAMHFATANYDKFGSDSAIIAINYVDTIKYLPEQARKQIAAEGVGILTVELLANVESSMFLYSSLSDEPFVTFFEPPSFDGRIVNQYAAFSFMSDPDADIESWLEGKDIDCFKIIIPKTMLWQVRDRLDQANISERMLFPGLDGVASWLKRHYKDART